MRILIVVLALVVAPLPALAAKVALVIGNDAYVNVTPLERAVADARAYRDMLANQRGFDVVFVENGNREEMIARMGEFLGRLRRDDVAMVVYSGHGVQLDPNRGDTLYLLPTDIPSVDPGSGGASFFMDAHAVNFARLSAEVSARGASLRIFVLDACRNNPFPASEGGRSVGLTRGLGAINASRGEFVFYAAAPGEVALDLLPGDDQSANSVFTRVFLKHFTTGAYLEDVANDVQAEVLDLSRRAAITQEPYYTDGVAGKTCVDNVCGIVPVVAPAPDPAPLADELEATYWRLCETRDSIAFCQAYVEEYPDGPHATLARLLVAELAADEAAAGADIAKPRIVTIGAASAQPATVDESRAAVGGSDAVPVVAAPAPEPELPAAQPDLAPLPVVTAPAPEPAPEPVAAPEPAPAAPPAPEPDTVVAAVEPAAIQPGAAVLQRQQQAGEAWARLADSWDIGAVRDYRAEYADTEQAAAADARIAFLREQHRQAQAELNRIGYNAGPVDGDWGRRSAAAMQGFQSDNGLAVSGMVDERGLQQLKAAERRVGAVAAAPAPDTTAETRSTTPPRAATPATTADPGGGGTRIAGLPPSDGPMVPDGSKWVAKAETGPNSRLEATLKRKGNTLVLDVDFDHRGNSRYYPRMIKTYSKRCKVSADVASFECYLPGMIDESRPAQPGGKVTGTFPNLHYEGALVIGETTLVFKRVR